MSIEIRVFTLGIAATNAYLVGDTETNEAILIDPVDNAPLLAETAKELGWTIKLIVATHGHFDHILASKELKELTGAPFWIHKDDLPLVENLPQTGLRFTNKLFPEAAKPDRLLDNGPEIIQVGSIRLKTLFTPGHARGHLALYSEDLGLVFSGDALFQGSIGRTDLPGGNFETLMTSIFEQLLTLDDATHVLSGHGDATTIGQERRTNPFILSYEA